MIDTYAMVRRAPVGGAVREHGEPVPEAHLWRTVESSVRAGQIAQTRLSEAEFAAAVRRYCPGDAEAIYARLGVAEPAVSRAYRARPVVVTGPVAIDDEAPRPRRARKAGDG